LGDQFLSSDQPYEDGVERPGGSVGWTLIDNPAVSGKLKAPPYQLKALRPKPALPLKVMYALGM
jgi:hypothetical protein